MAPRVVSEEWWPLSGTGFEATGGITLVVWQGGSRTSFQCHAPELDLEVRVKQVTGWECFLRISWKDNGADTTGGTGPPRVRVSGGWAGCRRGSLGVEEAK